MKTYTLAEACDLLNAERTTILDLVDVGEIPAAKIGRSWVFREQDLDAYLADKVRRQTAERQARATEAINLRVRNRNKSESATTGARTGRRQYPDLQAIGQPATAQVSVSQSHT